MDDFVSLLLLHLILLGLPSSRGSRQCPNGYFGAACKNRCGGHCSKNRCYLLPSGRSVNCTEGCVKGWRGTMCSRTCKIGCRECARFSGECIGNCRDGYYGPDCSTRCPGNCRKCNSINGRCEGECPIGNYGVFCTNKCSCKKCLKETGECLFVEPLSVTVTAPTNRGHRGDVQSKTHHHRSSIKKLDDHVHSNTNTHRSSDKKVGDGYDDDEDVRSKTYKHGVSITKLDDTGDYDDDDDDGDDDSKEVLHVDIPPQIVAVIVIMSVAAVLMLVAVPFVTKGRFACCAKICPSSLQGRSQEKEETSYRQKTHIYDEINDTVVKNWLLGQECDHPKPKQRMKTEDNEEYPKTIRSDNDMYRKQEAENYFLI